MTEKKKEVDCEYFLPYSKVCSAPVELGDVESHCIACLRPKNPGECLVKKYYADPGPYVNEEKITLFEFIQKEKNKK